MVRLTPRSKAMPPVLSPRGNTFRLCDEAERTPRYFRDDERVSHYARHSIQSARTGPSDLRLCSVRSSRHAFATVLSGRRRLENFPRKGAKLEHDYFFPTREGGSNDGYRVRQAQRQTKAPGRQQQRSVAPPGCLALNTIILVDVDITIQAWSISRRYSVRRQPSKARKQYHTTLSPSHKILAASAAA